MFQLLLFLYISKNDNLKDRRAPDILSDNPEAIRQLDKSQITVLVAIIWDNIVAIMRPTKIGALSDSLWPRALPLEALVLAMRRKNPHIWEVEETIKKSPTQS